MWNCQTYFSKLQFYPNSDHTITVLCDQKRTFEDPNSRPGETDSYANQSNNQILSFTGGQIPGLRKPRGKEEDSNLEEGRLLSGEEESLLLVLG